MTGQDNSEKMPNRMPTGIPGLGTILGGGARTAAAKVLQRLARHSPFVAPPPNDSL